MQGDAGGVLGEVAVAADHGPDRRGVGLPGGAGLPGQFPLVVVEVVAGGDFGAEPGGQVGGEAADQHAAAGSPGGVLAQRGGLAVLLT